MAWTSSALSASSWPVIRATRSSGVSEVLITGLLNKFHFGFQCVEAPANLSRRGRVTLDMHKYPGWRGGFRQSGGSCDSPVPEAPGRLARHRFPRIGRAVENRNRNAAEDAGPAVPARNLGQIVGPHDPHQLRRRETPLHHRQRIGGIAGAPAGLHAGDLDPGMARHCAGAFNPLGLAGHAVGRLQGILRTDQPPQLVELEALQRFQRDMQMPFMGRVERPAQHADPPLAAVAPTIWRKIQGRTCPVPRTTYLKLVSCSTPTGPRACSLPVEMPISAPMPNSPPSANWVEALTSTMALSTAARKASAAAASSVTMASV